MNKFGTAVILAGGQSSRMGFDKQFLQLNNQNIISYLSEKLLNLFDDIIVVSNTLPKGNYNNFRVISDVIKDKGPLSGIHSGLLSAKSEFVYFIACDMPNINLEYIEYMMEKIKCNNKLPLATVTRFKNWIEPFNSFYHINLVKKIESHLNNSRSIYALIKKIDSLLIDEALARKYSPNWDMFTNLNTKEDVKKFMDNEKITEFYQIKRFKNGSIVELTDEVIIEKLIGLYVNDEYITTFSCSPKSLKALAIGHLLSKGIIKKETKIDNIYIKSNCIKVISSQINSVSCKKSASHVLKIINPLNKDFLKKIDLSLEKIVNIMKEFSTYSETFIKTGAAHSTAFLSSNRIILFAEDVARHNAVDKLIGVAHLKNIDFSRLAILTSCRISGEIISKIVSQKIPIIISQSAPSNLAIDIAKKYNITLIGFARDNRLNIYTNFINLV